MLNAMDRHVGGSMFPQYVCAGTTIFQLSLTSFGPQGVAAVGIACAEGQINANPSSSHSSSACSSPIRHPLPSNVSSVRQQQENDDLSRVVMDSESHFAPSN